MFWNHNLQISRSVIEVAHAQQHIGTQTAEVGIVAAGIEIFTVWVGIHQIVELAFGYRAFFRTEMQQTGIELP